MVVGVSGDADDVTKLVYSRLVIFMASPPVHSPNRWPVSGEVLRVNVVALESIQKRVDGLHR